METPDPSRAVETSVQVRSLDFGEYLGQLQTDVLPHIRKLQADGHLRWYSFLLHPASQLAGRDPDDKKPVIHLRLEPAVGLDVADFIALLPPCFEKPVPRALAEVAGVDASILCDGDWAHAWHMVGESSEWVLKLLEDHQATPTPQQAIQFLHHVTNALAMSGSCMFMPGGFLPF